MKLPVSELSVKIRHQQGPIKTTIEYDGVEVKKGCPLWRDNEETLDDFPEYLDDSLVFLVTREEKTPLQTTISITTPKTVDIYIAYQNERATNGQGWLLDTKTYRKMRRQDHIQTSKDTTLSNISKTRLYEGNKHDLPPTKSENPLIAVFVKEVKGNINTDLSSSAVVVYYKL